MPLSAPGPAGAGRPPRESRNPAWPRVLLDRRALRRRGLALMARAWVMLGRPQAACGSLDALLDLDPAADGARALRAYLHAGAGRLAAAADDYRRLLARRPDDAPSWFNLGYVLQRAGDDAAAVQAFGRATTLDGGLDRAWYGSGLSLARLGRRDEAAAALARAASLQPLNPHAWVQLARVQHACARPHEVRRIVEHLRRVDPAAARRLCDEMRWPSAAPDAAG